MDAVKANDLRNMAELWGSARGPASGYMDDDELTQRLTILQRYLIHDRYEILVPQTAPLSAGQRTRVYQVRITRRGCTPVIPFTLVQSGQGWLVQSVDLSQAGSPTRRCQPPSGTGS